MGKLWVGIFAFAGGVAAGLLIAKAYAQAQIKGDISSALGAVGLGGGVIEATADKLIVPQ